MNTSSTTVVPGDVIECKHTGPMFITDYIGGGWYNLMYLFAGEVTHGTMIYRNGLLYHVYKGEIIADAPAYKSSFYVNGPYVDNSCASALRSKYV